MNWFGMWRRRFNESIQARLTFYFIMILLPLIFFSLYANERSQRILEQELGERTLSAMNSALEYVDLTVSSLKSLSTMISTDSNLTSRLKHDESVLSPEAIIDFMHVITQITNIRSVNPFLTEVTIFHGASKTIISSKVGALHRRQADAEPWYSEVVQANGANVIYLPDRREESLVGWTDPIYNTDQIVLMRLMDLYSRERSNNVLMLSVPKSKLLGYLGGFAPSEASLVYLFDDTGRLIVTNASGEQQRIDAVDIPAQRVSVREAPDSAEKNMTLKVESPDSGWSLLLVQPEREIYKKSKPLLTFSYWIIFISCLLAVWISWMIYSGIASPISSLAAGMRQLRRGNLNVRLENKRQDELGYLTDAFNQTVEQQRHLIRDIYEQQLRLTKTELKFLQSQINPHFLYNTLDSIYWAAKNYDADEISDMVLNLSRFFRLSLRKGRESFTIEETFEHLQYYIRVQQLRFVDQFDVEFRSTGESRNLHVLKLLLQPLVENAILHGLEKKAGGGRLTVAAEVRGDRLVLQVSDNGKGIDAERMERIRHALGLAEHYDSSSDTERQGAYFGLRNVKARIKIYYGATAEFRIESAAEEGTTATIDLPVELCSNEREGDEEPA
ncbi:cache domain-containing sensor histidine kinase [Paenibacillus harenae]|uniref:cache domain-containing sensor histidine kinase n=1 Tax=Paenibacillus harenae TaxID=306543 RepID=UPI0004237E86|nr:sensor histidine kinase [Paenibacillus harenae]